MKNTHRNFALISIFLCFAAVQPNELAAQEIPGTEVSSVQELFDITSRGEARAAYLPSTGEVFVAVASK